jgi:hypothetical protein
MAGNIHPLSFIFNPYMKAGMASVTRCRTALDPASTGVDDFISTLVLICLHPPLDTLVWEPFLLEHAVHRL